MGSERESFIRKERERCIEKKENARIIKGLVEEIIKKIEKIDYLNKIGDRVDELM